MNIEIRITLTSSELATYLSGKSFFQSELRERNITITGVTACNFEKGLSEYNDEFYVYLEGNDEDLNNFLSIYGYSDDEIKDILG